MSEFDNGQVTPTEEKKTGNGQVTPTTEPVKTEGAPVSQPAGYAGDKQAEEAALDSAASETDGSAAVRGEGVEAETKVDVFFEGRKVVRVLGREQQGPNYPKFVRSEMSDATTVDVPRDLFSESDLSDLEDKQ